MAVNGPMKLFTSRVPGADDRRAPDVRALRPRPRPRPRPGRRAGWPRRRAVDARLELLQQEPVGLEQRRELAGVDPPAGQHARCGPGGPWSISHWMASVISSSPRADGSIARTASWIVAVEQVHADEGEVGRRVGRLLDEARRRCRRRRARRCRSGAGRAPRFRRIWADGRLALVGPGLARTRRTNAGQVLLEQVVAEVHHEVVVAEELAGDRARSGPGRAARPGGGR